MKTPTTTTPRARRRSRALAASVCIGALALTGLAAAPSALADDPASSANWLEGYFNNIGIADAGSELGNIDGQQGFFVRGSGGLVSNTPYTLEGNGGTELTYSIAGGSEGTNDNISLNWGDAPVTIDTSLGLGEGAQTPATQLRFVGTSTYGSIRVSVTLHYADDGDAETPDSSAPQTLEFSDWCENTSQGGSTAILPKWPERSWGGNVQSLSCGLWASPVWDVPTGRTVEAITINPDQQPVDNQTVRRFHLFAIASDAAIDESKITIAPTGTLTQNAPAQYSVGLSPIQASGTLTWSTSDGPVTPDSVTYVWQVGGKTVKVGNDTYNFRAQDAGKTIKVSAVAKKSGLISGVATSNETTVALGTFNNTALPTVNANATPRVGDTITLTAGTYDLGDAIKSYQWTADNAPIAGATGASFVLTAAQLGKAIRVVETARYSGYVDQVATSAATAQVQQGVLVKNAEATISGTFATDQVLTIAPGVFTPSAAETYQWLADDSPIAGAVGTTFTVTADEVGKVISVEATATRDGYVTQEYTVTGSIVTVSDISELSAPTVTTSPTVNAAVTVTAGTYAPAGSTSQYQWLVNNVAVAGATATTYTPKPADLGKSLQVRVTVSAPGYADRVTTVDSGQVRPATLTIVKAPALTGTVRVGNPVKIVAGTYSVPGAALSYQWLRNGSAIAKATQATYTPVAADYRAGLAVRVSAKSAGYTDAIVTTNIVTVAIGKFKRTAKPVLKVGKKKVTAKRKVAVGKKLTVSKGKYSVKGVKVTYRWYVGSKKVAGAKGAKRTFKVRKSNVKKRIYVKLTVKKAGFSTITVTSVKTKTGARRLVNSRAALRGLARAGGPPGTPALACPEYGRPSRAAGRISLDVAVPPHRQRPENGDKRSGPHEHQDHVIPHGGPTHQRAHGADQVGHGVHVHVRLQPAGHRGGVHEDVRPEGQWGDDHHGHAHHRVRGAQQQGQERPHPPERKREHQDHHHAEHDPHEPAAGPPTQREAQQRGDGR